MLYSNIYGMIKLESFLNVIKSDSDNTFQMRAYQTEDNTRLIIFCSFMRGLPVFIDCTEISEQDYQDNKERIEKLNCYIIDC